MATHSVGRPETSEYPAYANLYIEKVPETDVLGAMTTSLEEMLAVIEPWDPSWAQTFRYAPGKWTPCESIGHVCDTERVLAYRALRIARGDQTPLPTFDHDAYVTTSPFSHFSPSLLAAELRAVRTATLSLFRALDEDAWMREGIASECKVTVRALAYFVVGHQRHHLELLRTRYV